MIFRVIAFVLLASALTISGYHRKKAERSGPTIPRKEEGAAALAARILIALPLLIGILLYVFWPSGIAWAEVAVPAWLRWSAAGIGVVAVAGSAWTLRSLGPNISPTVLTRRDQRLVTRGPYRWIRHPLYACGTLLLFSLGVIARNVLLLAWTVLALAALLTVVIPREERHLIERFGAAYDEYRSRTGALLPWKKGVKDSD